MNNQGTEFEGVKIERAESIDPMVFHSTILKEIRSWAITLLVLGVISLFASGFLSAPWGVLLIAVGLASFYFRSSSMMVVYAVTLAWAGISNISSGQIFWIGFAVFQAFLVYRVFKKFISFRQVETNSGMEEASSSGLTLQRCAGIFPWAAGGLGVFSFLGLIGLFIGVIALAVLARNHTVPAFLSFIEGLVVNCGVLGFAVGLASVLSKFPRKAIAIAGMVTGILTLITEIILKFV
jgi:hypothetical protein